MGNPFGNLNGHWMMVEDQKIFKTFGEDLVAGNPEIPGYPWGGFHENGLYFW